VKNSAATYRIGDLARRAGVSADTIRHYERTKLIPAAPRDANGYRRFSAAALQRVIVIQCALDAGFTLNDLRRVFRVRDGGGAPCREVYAIAERRLEELRTRIGDLQALETSLRATLGDWRGRLDGQAPGVRVGLLDSFAERARHVTRARSRRQPKSSW
jgi:DNA-binding transcriptional MerR regulator